VRGRNSKIKNFDYDRMIDRFIYHGHIGFYGYGRDKGLDPVTAPCYDWNENDRRVSSRTARLMFVPKDLKTSRSICMEPNVLQYHQQGILANAMSLIGKSLFSGFIQLENQSENRSLARKGSFSSLIDTIDLSSASDCLSYDLVKKVFPPSWQIVMRATRSDKCYTPNGVHTLLKFAPMGSALCFPTQCIVFSACVVYAACLYTYGLSPCTQSFDEWLECHCVDVIKSFYLDNVYTIDHSIYNRSRVYGDDICCDSRITSNIYSILDRLGFIVNHDKSFTGSQSFRESCGGFYLDGADVTPLYFRIKDSSSPKSGEFLASAISLCNSAYLRGYFNTYRYLRDVVLSYHHNVCYVQPLSGSFGIYCDSPHNKHLVKRFNQQYQRWEMQTVSLSYARRSAFFQDADLYEYMRWRGTHNSDVLDAEQSAHSGYDRAGARVVRRWMPTTE